MRFRTKILIACFFTELAIAKFYPPPLPWGQALIWASGWTLFSGVLMWIITPRWVP